MKTIAITIVVLIVSTLLSAQGNHFRVPDEEYTFIEVHASYPETLNPERNKYGLDYVIEVGVSSFINRFAGFEAKIGYESFDALTGGYFDLHAGFGLKWVHGRDQQYNYYIGGRFAKVWRKGPRIGKANRKQLGLEAKFTIDIYDTGFYWGGRFTYDDRQDMDIMDWIIKNVASVFITFGIKLGDL